MCSCCNGGSSCSRKGSISAAAPDNTSRPDAAGIGVFAEVDDGAFDLLEVGEPAFDVGHRVRFRRGLSPRKLPRQMDLLPAEQAEAGARGADLGPQGAQRVFGIDLGHGHGRGGCDVLDGAAGPGQPSGPGLQRLPGEGQYLIVGTAVFVPAERMVFDEEGFRRLVQHLACLVAQGLFDLAPVPGRGGAG